MFLSICKRHLSMSDYYVSHFTSFLLYFCDPDGLILFSETYSTKSASSNGVKRAWWFPRAFLVAYIPPLHTELNFDNLCSPSVCRSDCSWTSGGLKS